jgi:hypothetical protein
MLRDQLAEVLAQLKQNSGDSSKPPSCGTAGDTRFCDLREPGCGPADAVPMGGMHGGNYEGWGSSIVRVLPDFARRGDAGSGGTSG